MKVLVIGAADASGQQIVAQALAAGHTVTAFVHNAAKYQAPNGVRVLVGDATDAAVMEQAVAGQEAVVDAIGNSTPFLPTHLEEQTAKAVTAAMQQHGVRRLVVISVVGIGTSTEQLGFWYRNLLAPVFLYGALPDKEAIEAEIRRSNLDFVIVRPPALTNGPATGAAHVVPAPTTAHRIARANLAQFIVAQLTSDHYLGQAVTVADV